jgi:hypothetical protein
MKYALDIVAEAIKNLWTRCVPPNFITGLCFECVYQHLGVLSRGAQ